MTPLDIAMFGDHTETASLLKKCGGDLSIDTKVIYIYIYIYELFLCLTLHDVTLIQ